MNAREVAGELLRCIGGKDNVTANDLCMTRLRIQTENPTLVDIDSLNALPGVLGVVRRGQQGVEVVFGPYAVGGIFDALTSLTNIPDQGQTAIEDDAPTFRFQISSATRDETIPHIQELLHGKQEAKDSENEADELGSMLQAAETNASNTASSNGEPEGLRLLVINGPNINMLGIREPDLYGTADYAALLDLCKRTAAEEGFSGCLCFQSNHEGDIVDVIQDAYDIYAGIIINPGAFTHTSIAILDALKAVSIPTIEVHISKVDEREDFRQVSYVRAACFETIIGLGIDGYAKAISDMAEYLKKHNT